MGWSTATATLLAQTAVKMPSIPATSATGNAPTVTPGANTAMVVWCSGWCRVVPTIRCCRSTAKRRQKAHSRVTDRDSFALAEEMLRHPDGRAAGGEPRVQCGRSVLPNAHRKQRDRHVCSKRCDANLIRKSNRGTSIRPERAAAVLERPLQPSTSTISYSYSSSSSGSG